MRTVAATSFALVVVFFAGCAEVAQRTPRKSCQRDDQCDGVCVVGECKARCATTADCLAGETCAAVNGGATACVGRPGQSDGGGSGDVTPPVLTIAPLSTVTTRTEFSILVTASEPLQEAPQVKLLGRSAPAKSALQNMYTFGFTPAASDVNGTYMVEVEARDVAGNTGATSAPVTFAFGGAGPTVTGVTVTNTSRGGANTPPVLAARSDVLQIVATANQLLSGTGTNALTVGGVAAIQKSIVGSIATFDFTVPANDTSGTRELVFTLTSASGTATSAPVSGKLEVDADPPTLTVLPVGVSLSQGFYDDLAGHPDKVQVNVTASDPHGPALVSAYLEGATPPPFATFSSPVSVAWAGNDGPVSVCVKAADAVANTTAEKCAMVNVDRDGPQAPGSFAANVVGRAVTVSWTDAKDVGAGVKEYRLQFGGPNFDGVAAVGASPLTLTGTSMTLNGLPFGAALRARVTAVDWLGHAGAGSVEATFTIPPPFTWVAPKFGGPTIQKVRCLDASLDTCLVVTSNGATAGLARTANGGQTFSNVDYGPAGPISLLEVGEKGGGALGFAMPASSAYLLVTTDGGNTWRRRSFSAGTVGVAEPKAVTWPDPLGHPGTLVLAVQLTDGGTTSVQLHQSTDGGATFTRQTATGLPTTVNFLLTRDGASQAERYVLGSANGVYENDVAGDLGKWSSKSAGSVTAGAFLASKVEGLLAGPSSASPTALTFDAGLQAFKPGSWSCAGLGVPFELFYPASARVWMMVGLASGNAVCTSSSSGSSWSAPNLAAWQLDAVSPPPNPTAAFFAPGGAGLLGARDSDLAYLAKTVDHGATFTAWGAGLWQNGLNDRKNPAGLFFVDDTHGWLTDQTASTYGNGLYRTLDGGATWTRVAGPSACSVAPNLVFANPSLGFAFGAGGVCATANGGDDWSLVPGTTALAAVRSLDIVSGSPLEGYLVTAAGEVESVTAGAITALTSIAGSGTSIAQTTDGTDRLVVAAALSTSPATPVLYVATRSGGGAWGAWSTVPVPSTFGDGAKFGPVVFPGRTGTGFAFSSAVPRVLATTDAFTTSTDRAPSGASGITGGFFSPSCESATRCFALAKVGAATHLFLTEDGFASVRSLTAGYPGWPTDAGRLFMLPTGVGYAQGVGTLVKTTTRWQ